MRTKVRGLWIAENEGAKFWYTQPSLSQTGVANAVCAVPLLMGVLTGLKNRGVQDILIACMDGLANLWFDGFPDALRAVYPQTRIQLCIVHMVRNSVKFVSYKDLKKLCADLKQIYSAADEEAGLDALEELGRKWNDKYPMIYQSWQRHWNDLSEFYKYPPEIRRTYGSKRFIRLTRLNH